MSADLDEILRLIGEEPVGRSVLDDAAFRHRLAGIDPPSIEEDMYPKFLVTALVAAAIGMSSQLVSDFNKPLPGLIEPQRLSLLERRI